MDILRWAKFKEHSWLIIFAVIVFFIYSLFSWHLPWRFNSPDEAANAYFTQRIARAESMAVPEPLNYVIQNPIVHPRSTQIVNGQLAPASFLGLPLMLGFVGRITGESTLPYLTPLGAIIGLLCFFGVVRELSGRKAAWIAVWLLSITPAFWYYHSRSFFHNALFFDFLLLAIYLLIKALKNKNIWVYLASGLALGLALALRTSEIFWIAAAGLVWLGLSWQQVKWKNLLLLIAVAVVSFSPVLFTNYQIYGSIFSVGYRQDLALTGDLQQTLGLLQQLVLPFGWHPHVILSTVTNYLINLTWWWAAVAVVGLSYFLISWRKQSKQAKNFMVGILIMVCWLIVVYGSWQFNDNPNPQAITLGTSYARYWLPIYSLLLWPASLALSRLLNWKWGKELLIALVGCYAVLSGLLVWSEPTEGLAQIKSNIQRFQIWSQEVQAQTQGNSVIVTGITDKVFWPERQVIYDLINPADYVAVNKLLVAGVPVYWFHPTWPADGLAAMNNRLAGYNLTLASQAFGWQDFSLYKFGVKP